MVLAKDSFADAVIILNNDRIYLNNIQLSCAMTSPDERFDKIMQRLSNNLEFRKYITTHQCGDDDFAIFLKNSKGEWCPPCRSADPTIIPWIDDQSRRWYGRICDECNAIRTRLEICIDCRKNVCSWCTEDCDGRCGDCADKFYTKCFHNATL